jgi:hypothetical protein
VKPDSPQYSEKIIAIVNNPLEVAEIPARYSTSTTANGTFVIQIHQAVIANLFGWNNAIRPRHLRQTPRSQYVTRFQHEIPMKSRIIVFENHESGHD